MICLKLIKRINLYAVLWLGAVVAYAQDTRVTGTIVDASTGEAIEFAHVRIGDVISYSNEDGIFSLRVPGVAREKLEVFHMGFEMYSSDGNPANGQEFNIELKPVKPTDASGSVASVKELMKDVFLRFLFNYEMNEQLLLSYYKEKISDNGEIHYLAEGIMEILLPSNVDKASTLVRPMKTRTRLLAHFSNKEVSKLNGHAAEMVKSSIWLENSFLSEKNRWNYEYTLAGQEVHRGYDVFLVNFKPKEGNTDEAGFEGTLYIDLFSHAIIRIDYNRRDDVWTTERWEEEFQHHDHTYYLLRASHEVTWQEGGTEHTYSSFVINTEVEPNSNKIAWEKFIEGNKFLFPVENTGTFDEAYWGRFNYIPLSEDEKNQLN